MQPNIAKECVGLAGEYAVASELCKRGMYAQLTLGHHKSTDILVETEDRMLRMAVRTKRGNEWPSIAGLYKDDQFLVLVDLQGKADTERPDFYVLNVADWEQLILEARQRWQTLKVDAQNRITYPDGWKGLNIKPKRVLAAKERWDKIVQAICAKTTGG